MLPRSSAHTHPMSTPVKSPAQKKSRGDDALDDANVVMRTNERQSEPSVTLSAIKGLLQESLNPLHASVKEMKRDLSDFKVEVMEDISQVKSRVGKVEDNMKMANIRMKDLEGKVDQAAAPRANPDLEKKVQEMKDIEKSMKSMLSQSAAAPLPGASAQDVTAVIGGLSGLSTLEEAEAWVRKQLGEWKLSAPLRIYKKDDDFKGLAFARFSNHEAMSATVEAFNSKGIMLKEKKIWSKVERPIHIRAPNTFLFRLKALMTQWGYDKKSVYVNEDLGSMDICGVRVLTATVKDGSLNLDWILKDFESWQELQTNADYLANIEKCNESLKSSRGAQSKGVGKGPLTGSV